MTCKTNKLFKICLDLFHYSYRRTTPSTNYVYKKCKKNKITIKSDGCRHGGKIITLQSTGIVVYSYDPFHNEIILITFAQSGPYYLFVNFCVKFKVHDFYDPSNFEKFIGTTIFSNTGKLYVIWVIFLNNLIILYYIGCIFLVILVFFAIS